MRCRSGRLPALSVALVSLLALSTTSLLLSIAAFWVDRWIGQLPIAVDGSARQSSSFRRLENRLGATLTLQNGVPFVWRPDVVVPMAESVGFFRTLFSFVRDVEYEVIYSFATKSPGSCNMTADGQNRSRCVACSPSVGIVRNEWDFRAAVRNLFGAATSSLDSFPYIEMEKVCDGRPDCPSWSDESSCNRSATYAAGLAGSGNDTCCRDYPMICGVAAAPNSSSGVPAADYCSPALASPSGGLHALRCTNESALSAAAEAGTRRCDGVAQCFDFSDETACGLEPTPSSSFQPLVTGGNGNTGNDETYAQCKSGQRIRKAALCDQHVDCRDGSDEAGCEHRSAHSAAAASAPATSQPETVRGDAAAIASGRATFVHVAAGTLEYRSPLFLAAPIVRDASTQFHSCVAGLALGALSAAGAALALPARLHVHLKLVVLLSCACGLAAVACYATALSGWARAAGDENSAVAARWLAVADAADGTRATATAAPSGSSDGRWQLRYEVRAFRYELCSSASLLAVAAALATLSVALQILLICSLRWTSTMSGDDGDGVGGDGDCTYNEPWDEAADDATDDLQMRRDGSRNGDEQSSFVRLSHLDRGEDGGEDDGGDVDHYGGAEELISQPLPPQQHSSSSLGRMSMQRKSGFY